jgi:hypothetical protein
LPLKPEQLPLFGPVGGEFERQPRQPLCAEFRRVFAVDDGRDDIGCERWKPQQGLRGLPTTPRQIPLLSKKQTCALMKSRSDFDP